MCCLLGPSSNTQHHSVWGKGRNVETSTELKSKGCVTKGEEGMEGEKQERGERVGREGDRVREGRERWGEQERGEVSGNKDTETAPSIRWKAVLNVDYQKVDSEKESRST